MFFLFYFLFFLFVWLDDPHRTYKHLVHKTASLADEDKSAYCQSSDAHNIKHI